MVQIMDGADVQTTDSAGSLDQQVNLDVAGRTEFNIYTTHFNAAYYFTGKTSLSAGADYRATDYTSLISSETFSGNLFLNYDYSPKLVIGPRPAGRILRWPIRQTSRGHIRASYHATTGSFTEPRGLSSQFEGDIESTFPVYECE